MPPRISAAMIVKDEGFQLADCLKALDGLADELCIVDTGSVDDTLEVAHEFHAKVAVYLWSDDFAAARNESLRLCTGDWILMIDADERFSEADRERVRALTAKRSRCAYRFTVRNYTDTTTVAEFHPSAPDDPDARDFAGWYPCLRVRLWPADTHARFEGNVHELIGPALRRKGVEIVDVDIPIHHYPLMKPPGRIQQKREMYLRMGHDKVASNPKDANGYAELGNQYAELGEYEKAAAAYKECLRLAPNTPTVLRDLGGMLVRLNRYDEAKKALKLSIQLAPDAYDAWRNLGVAYAEEKKWDKAIECFRKGIDAEPRWKEGPRYLSVALQGANHWDEAAVESRKALESLPRSHECLSLFIHQMLRLEKRAEARGVLIELLKKTDVPELHNAVGELFYFDGMHDESIAHFQAAADLGLSAAWNNLGVVHFKEKRYQDARNAFLKCLEVDPGHPGAERNAAKCKKLLQKG